MQGGNCHEHDPALRSGHPACSVQRTGLRRRHPSRTSSGTAPDRRRGAPGRGEETRSAARSSPAGAPRMSSVFCQAMSLCLALAPAGVAESGPARPAACAHEACVEESNTPARLAPLWLAAPEPAGPGAAGARLYRLQAPQAFNKFHLARFRGRAGCGAPGPSSSRFLPATERSPSAISRVRRPGDLTDLHGRRVHSGRGGAVRDTGFPMTVSPSLLRVQPARASVLSVVSSSLYQSQ